MAVLPNGELETPENETGYMLDVMDRASQTSGKAKITLGEIKKDCKKLRNEFERRGQRPKVSGITGLLRRIFAPSLH